MEEDPPGVGRGVETVGCRVGRQEVGEEVTGRLLFNEGQLQVQLHACV